MLDLIAPVVGLVGLVAAGIAAGDPAWLSVARVVVGAAFLGAVTDAMLLGHWYLVQPGMPRGSAARAGALGGGGVAVRGGRAALADRHGAR